MRLSGLFYPLATLRNKIKVPEVSFSNSKSDGKTRFQARNSLRHSDFGKIIEQSTIVSILTPNMEEVILKISHLGLTIEIVFACSAD